MLIQQKIVNYPLSHTSNEPKICMLTLWGILLQTSIVRNLGPLDFDGQEGEGFLTIKNVTVYI